MCFALIECCINYICLWQMCLNPLLNTHLNDRYHFVFLVISAWFIASILPGEDFALCLVLLRLMRREGNGCDVVVVFNSSFVFSWGEHLCRAAGSLCSTVINQKPIEDGPLSLFTPKRRGAPAVFCFCAAHSCWWGICVAFNLLWELRRDWRARLTSLLHSFSLLLLKKASGSGRLWCKNSSHV